MTCSMWTKCTKVYHKKGAEKVEASDSITDGEQNSATQYTHKSCKNASLKDLGKKLKLTRPRTELIFMIEVSRKEYNKGLT